MRTLLILILSTSFGCGQLPGADSKKSQSARGAPRLTSESEDARTKKPKKPSKHDGTNHRDGSDDADDQTGSNQSDLPASTLAWDGEKFIGSSTLNLAPIE